MEARQRENSWTRKELDLVPRICEQYEKTPTQKHRYFLTALHMPSLCSKRIKETTLAGDPPLSFREVKYSVWPGWVRTRLGPSRGYLPSRQFSYSKSNF